MSAQQPRAYNYVTNEDFSANASGQGAANGAPSQFQQEQQHYTYTNDQEPSEPQHQAPPPQFHPESKPHSQTPPPPQFHPESKPHGQQYQAQQPPPPPVNNSSHPPPVNNASHPAPNNPAPHYESKPPPQPYNSPQQQWGQQSFYEKFEPPATKPKWNDVALSSAVDGSYGRHFSSLRFSLHSP
jgi:hypothetical protein